MSWKVRIINEAQKDYSQLDNGVKKQVLAGILKVSKAPLPSPEGYGKPLGNKNNNNLTGLLKIKFRDIGIRVVYKLVEDEKTHEMYILIISARADSEVYDLAGKRK